MDNKKEVEEINIQKYWLVLKRRWSIAVGIFATCVGLAGVSLLLQKPAYEASGRLLFQLSRTSSLTGVGEKIGDLESIRREANPIDTQALLVQSMPVKQEVVNVLQLKNEQGKPLEPDEIAIDAEAVTGTDVLKVSHFSRDPELAKAVVNEVMKSYVDKNVQNNRAEATAARKFLQSELPKAQFELERAAEALRRFKAQNQIIELQEEKSGTVKTMTELDEELNIAQSTLADLSGQEAAIRQQLKSSGEQIVDITSLSQAPGVQNVLSELQKVQTELATLRAVYTSSHPNIAKLREQEASLKSLLRQQTNTSLGYQANIDPSRLQIGAIKQDLAGTLSSIQAQRQGLQQKITSLFALKENYKNRADRLPNLEKQQGGLERRLLAAQQAYENLSTRFQEVKVAENQNIGNARILESAKVYPSPKAMKQKLMIGTGGLFAGALLGIAGAFFVDLIDRRLKTAKEAESLFGYTMLGLIPKYEINRTGNEEIGEAGVFREVIVATSPRSIIHEAYQMLQANLKFISLDKKVRTIVVTSSVPGEGKTEVSANLAAIIAQTGRRVLLVDADMRRPAQHHRWGLINSEGLSNVVVGQQVFSRAVQKVTSHLSIITAGVTPPNPLALIDSERMTSLIDMWSDSYDYVIFDTPPLIGTADAAVLGKMADGVLVVARPGVVDSTNVAAAKSLLVRSEANILGIVANGVNIRQEPDNYFYYNTTSHSDFSLEKVSTKQIETKS